MGADGQTDRHDDDKPLFAILRTPLKTSFFLNSEPRVTFTVMVDGHRPRGKRSILADQICRPYYVKS